MDVAWLDVGDDGLVFQEVRVHDAIRQQIRDRNASLSDPRQSNPQTQRNDSQMGFHNPNSLQRLEYNHS